jgi:hypothetical protein
MKIYFEDGKLNNSFFLNNLDSSYIIANVDAGMGYSRVTSRLDKCLSLNERFEVVVYTNSLLALTPKYTWDEKLGKHEVYIHDTNGKWVHVDELTNRDLHKQVYKIANMYISGEFDYERFKRDFMNKPCISETIHSAQDKLMKSEFVYNQPNPTISNKKLFASEKNINREG